MTYSIVVRDPNTGAFGVAAQSHFFSVGSVLAWAEPGHGAVATQAFVNPSYGPLGLRLLASRASSADALTQLLTADAGADLRQVAMIDAHGDLAVHTGRGCVGHAGDAQDGQATAQANMMASDQVWQSMLSAYTGSSGDMADRLLLALKAGESAGGDVRGRQSACLIVVTGQTIEEGGRKLIDLRVDDHVDPLAELDRLLLLHRQYDVLSSLLAQGMFDRINEATLNNPISEDRLEAGLERLVHAQHVLGEENQEFNFWRGVILARAGRGLEARQALTQASRRHAGWAQLFSNLQAAGLLRNDGDGDDALLSR